MADRDFLREYGDLIKRLDVAITETAELHADRLRCAPGCSSCCTISSVLPIEAALLRQAVRLLADETKRKVRTCAGGSSCPLLLAERCVVYRNRPVICRTQGLPIGYVDYERQAVDVSVCPINFSEDYDFEQQELFFIDPFNGELARLNEEFCVACGINPLIRVAMQSLMDEYSGLER